MSQDRFLQLHFLTAYPGVLLNRDDMGMAKRLPFGGVTRTRISSQCLKRHWRTHQGEYALSALPGVEMSIRSRKTFARLVADPLIREEGLDAARVQAAVASFQQKLLGKSEKSKKKDEEGMETGQVVILGWPEIRFVKEKVRELVTAAADVKGVEKGVEELFKAEKKNFQSLMETSGIKAGLDAALFGRMVTSDLLSRLDAAVHVAHAFTVHGEEAETDYFSAVDDLSADNGELGSGHINDSELTSGFYYGYVVVDLPLLVSNLEGVPASRWREADRTLAGQVVASLVHLLATVSPGAKKGSTAPYAYADLVLVESGSRQPRTLANAFLEPVSRSGQLRAATIRRLGEYLSALDVMYGGHESRRVASLQETAVFPAERIASLDAVADWAASRVRGEG